MGLRREHSTGGKQKLLGCRKRAGTGNRVEASADFALLCGFSESSHRLSIAAPFTPCPAGGEPERDIDVHGWAGFNSVDWAADGKSVFVSNQSPTSATLLRGI
jgi:hypothetical protein